MSAQDRELDPEEAVLLKLQDLFFEHLAPVTHACQGIEYGHLFAKPGGDRFPVPKQPGIMYRVMQLNWQSKGCGNLAPGSIDHPAAPVHVTEIAAIGRV